jgi:PAS domain S-box-containing protein
MADATAVLPALSDPARLAAVEETALLGPADSEILDRLTRLGAAAVGAPAALITLLSAEREYIKASYGDAGPWTSERQVPIEASFCKFVVGTGEPLIVRNAQRDRRVRDNPAIARVHLVAYAGFPLRHHACVLGAYAVLDHRARAWTPRQRELLSDFAALASQEIERALARARADRERAALRENEERFRLVARATNDVVWDWDVRSGRMLWSDAAPRSLRYPPGELGATIEWWYEHIHPEDRERVATGLHAVIEGADELWTDEYRFRRGDGSYLMMRDRGVVVRDAKSHPVRMLGSMTDVTERRRAEETQRFLARASTLLSATLDYETAFTGLARLAVPTLADYCLVDLLEGEVIRRVAVAHIDPRMEKVLLRNELHSIRDNPRDHPVVQVVRTGESVLVTECTSELLDRIAGTPERRRMLEELELRSFVVVPLRARGRVLGAITLAASAASGRVYQPIDVVDAEDLGRRAGMAIDNAQLYEEAQRAIRAREEVLGVVSHDLRNPLNVIMLSAAQLDSEDERRTGTAELYERIERAARQMEAMIRDLLDLSSIDAGGFAVNLEHQELAPVLREAEQLQRPLAAGKSLALHLEIAEPLPPLAFDNLQLLRVLSNLIGNAIKYTPSGGSITLRAMLQASSVRVSVTDTGPGIAPEQLPFVFDRYWQATPGDRHGVGLGLPIAKGIVEAHGGTIGVESTPGAGTTFWFTLPL